jgi:hypothetical protein
MNYKLDNKIMKKFLSIILLFVSFHSFSQTIITDSNFEKTIEGRSAFNDDGISIVVVEFWASFNDDNAFADWDKLKGIKYYRCDIAKSPKAKKNHKVRTIPHIIIFKDGYDEKHFKAGLDFSIRQSVEEIQEAIDELKQESKF